MAGLHGPVAAVMGKNGLEAFVAEGADLSALVRNPLLGHHLDAVSIKRYPCIGTAQATVSAAQALHAPLQKAASPIESVQVHLGDSPLIRHQCSSAYLHPQDRETADHSFLSLIGMTLLDGTLAPDQFDRRRYLDADVKAVSEQLHFHFDLAGAEQGLFSARIEVRLRDGKSLQSQALHPPGHPLRPLSAEELSRKFLDCALPHMSQEKAQGLLENCLQAPLHTPMATVLKPLSN
jgi:2-methylcitrate dehydratase